MDKQLLTMSFFSRLKLTTLFLFICCWLYTSISFGYFTAKIFNENFNNFTKNNVFKRLKLVKKFTFKDITTTILKFYRKLIGNWLIRIFSKSIALQHAIDQSINSILIFFKKIFKHPFAWKYNFAQLIHLMNIFGETFLVFCSLINEILIFQNIKNWIVQWFNFIQLLMIESKFRAKIICTLYFLILALFGIVSGILIYLFTYKDEINEIYLFILFLSNIIHNKKLNNILLDFLQVYSLETHGVEKFSKFSLEVCKETNPRPSKLVFKKVIKKSKTLLPILDDPPILVDINYIFEKSPDYIFELFSFYKDVNQKV